MYVVLEVNKIQKTVLWYLLALLYEDVRNFSCNTPNSAKKTWVLTLDEVVREGKFKYRSSENYVRRVYDMFHRFNIEHQLNFDPNFRVYVLMFTKPLKV